MTTEIEMTPIELTARREALGVGVHALADYLEVRHQNLARWEVGKNPPRSWGWIDEALTELENFQQQLIDELIDAAETSYEATGEFGIITYRNDDNYWAWIDDARERGIPVGVHRAAAARAAVWLRRQQGVRVDVAVAPWAE